MEKYKKRPDSAVTVTLYSELGQYVQAFAAGHLNLFILVGSPGIEKSRALRAAVGHDAFWIEGHATPFGIYRCLWHKRNRPVVIDDVDALYASRDGLRLLKSVCQSEPVKRVSWHSGAPILRREGIPRVFHTTSRVAIIANEWRTLDRNVAALEDRGICVTFEPTPLEVHTRTGAWFWDQEIFDFLGERLHLLGDLSMRLYRQLWELKTAGMDWRAFLLGRTLSGRTLLVARLKASAIYPSEKERVEAFIAAGGGSRATYFNHAKKLGPAVDPPRIILTSKPPTARNDAVLKPPPSVAVKRAPSRWGLN
jgi:hypothetical protein